MMPLSNASDDDGIDCPNCGRRVPHTLQCRLCGGDLIAPLPPSPPPPPEPDRQERPAAAVELVVSSGARLRILAGQTIGIGRHEDYVAATVFGTYTNVSRLHGKLRYDGDLLYVTDTSINGTFVNDMRIPRDEERAVGRDDTLRLAADVPITIEWGP
ncbi:FHA domain-containing protein [Nocardia sp. NPDC059240]|uniref:FHA domain-containing protein n=1 Tax=Nocardia sp. NPDC059240 TaxID=3346786 RepID=UPI0036C9A589